MGDLRIEAQELLKIKKQEKEYNYIKDNLAEYQQIELNKVKSMQIFTEKIKYQIDNFQKHLMETADKGEVLKIDIMRLDSKNLVSWWEERDNKISKSIYREYSPIKSEIVTFIDDINLDFLTDDIILDKTLKELYNTIRSYDIYPQWRVNKNSDGKITSLYLEVNPLISYKDRKDALAREKEIKQRALVVVTKSNGQNITKQNNKNRVKKITNFIFRFVLLLYFTVAIFTILSGLIGVSNTSNSSSFLEIAWPYFIITDFLDVSDKFIFSLPLGIIITLYFAYKRN